MRSDRPKNLFQMKYLIFHPDNVLLTHVIKTKIKVDEIENNLEVNVCKFCSKPASVYCNNCHEYFCPEHDELVHATSD